MSVCLPRAVLITIQIWTLETANPAAPPPATARENAHHMAAVPRSYKVVADHEHVRLRQVEHIVHGARLGSDADSNHLD